MWRRGWWIYSVGGPLSGRFAMGDDQVLVIESVFFCETVRRQLDAIDVGKLVEIYFGKRRTLRMHEKEVVGFEVCLTELTDEEFICVQKTRACSRKLS